MNKLPAFQFYPADWRKDPGVQSLSWHDRGVWIEILCLMHESPRRGVLLMPSGAPMLSVSLARIIGLPLKETIKCLERLVEAGVASREPDTGALLNRRMVRDESIRYVRTEAGRLGGNPNLLKQNRSKSEPPTEIDDKQKSTPSSSSSTSSSEEGELKPLSAKADAVPKYPEDFQIFWADSTRRGSKVEAYREWQKIKPSPDLLPEILVAMAAWRQSEQWQDESKQPHLCRWLKRRGWEEIVPRSNGNGQLRESTAEFNQRKTREASLELLRRVDEQIGGSVSDSDLDGNASDVSGQPVGSAARSARSGV